MYRLIFLEQFLKATTGFLQIGSKDHKVVIRYEISTNNLYFVNPKCKIFFTVKKMLHSFCIKSTIVCYAGSSMANIVM